MTATITPAMRTLLWALAAGDTLRYEDNKKRNPFWFTLKGKQIHDRRTCNTAYRRGYLVCVAMVNFPWIVQRDYEINDAGKLALRRKAPHA